MTARGDTFFLPDAPAIPGLVFRPFRDPSDYEHMANIAQHAFLADGMDFIVTAEQQAAYYAPSASCDPSRDILFAEVGGSPVAVAFVGRSIVTGGVRFYGLNGRVLPAWRGLGLGRALLRRNERLQRLLAAGDPPDPRAFSSQWPMTAQCRRERFFAARATRRFGPAIP